MFALAKGVLRGPGEDHAVMSTRAGIARLVSPATPAGRVASRGDLPRGRAPRGE
jgi:hypothetical protein